MDDQATFDVAIIGYGPVGATAANILGRCGLDVVVVERDPDIYFRARAISVDEEVMRIWQQVGLADRLGADMQPGNGADFVNAKERASPSCSRSAEATVTLPSSSSINPSSTGHSARASTDFPTSRFS